MLHINNLISCILLSKISAIFVEIIINKLSITNMAKKTRQTNKKSLPVANKAKVAKSKATKQKIKKQVAAKVKKVNTKQSKAKQS